MNPYLLEINNLQNGNRKQPLLRCSFCKNQFYGIRKLKKHIKAMHQNTKGVLENSMVDIKKPYRCRYCEKAYFHRPNLGLHMNIHLKSYTCSICQTPFRSTRDLNRHCASAHIHKSAIHSCEYCHVRFSDITALANHRRKLHPDEMQCSEMPEVKDDTSAVINNTEKQFKCTLCDKTYSFQPSLVIHMNLHLKSYTCHICQTPFAEERELKRHNLTAHTVGDATHSCHICQVNFTNKLSVIHHKRKVHLIEPKCKSKGDPQKAVNTVKLFKCQICSKKFSDDVSLSYHQKMHTTEESINVQDSSENSPKRFKCQLCSKAYNHQTTLTSHMHLHSKTFTCSICQTPFATVKELNRHNSTAHVNNPQHSCPECHVKFNEMIALANHRRKVHVWEAEISDETEEENALLVSSKPKSKANSLIRKRGLKKKQHKYQFERTHVCRICQKVFCWAKHLQNHMYVHLENPNFPCKECDAKFQTSRALIYHRKKHHPGSKLKFSHRTSFCRTKYSENLFEEFDLKNTIHIRQSCKEDPDIWPKVLLSKRLNDLLMSSQ